MGGPHRRRDSRMPAGKGKNRPMIAGGLCTNMEMRRGGPRPPLCPQKMVYEKIILSELIGPSENDGTHDKCQ